MNNHLKIMKFGGSSLGTADSINRVISIISNDNSINKIVIVSAQGGMTDMLLNLMNENNLDEVRDHINRIIEQLGVVVPAIEELFDELSSHLSSNTEQNQLRDCLASYGELISANIVSTCLNSKNIKTTFVDARKIIRTDSNFTNANYDSEITKKNCEYVIAPLLKDNNIPVVTGFIGQSADGCTTTLGRGGSDLTATLIGQCLNADIIEIWSDVDGIMTADPRFVNNSNSISHLTYKEAIELSNFGAKVIYGKALIPAIESNIPVNALNTFSPDSMGTIIHSTESDSSFSIASKEDISIITVYNPRMIGAVGYLAKFFNTFNNMNMSIDIISVSEASISVTLNRLSPNNRELLATNLQPFGEIEIKNNCSIVAIVSQHLQHNQKIFSQILETLNENNIHVSTISYGNSEINLMLVISDSTKTIFTVKRIHELLLLMQLP